MLELRGLRGAAFSYLTGHDLQDLGGQTDGSLDAEVLCLGTLDELSADLLKGLNLLGGQGDTDAVGLGGLAGIVALLLVGRHLCGLDGAGGWF